MLQSSVKKFLFDLKELIQKFKESFALVRLFFLWSVIEKKEIAPFFFI